MSRKKTSKSSRSHKRSFPNIYGKTNAYLLIAVITGIALYSIFSFNKSANFPADYSARAIEGDTGATGPTGPIFTDPSPTSIYDLIPPSAPTNLTAFYYQRVVKGEANKITLTWGPSYDNVGLKEYRLYKNGVLYRTLSPTTLTFTENATDGATYPKTDFTCCYYYVIGVDFGYVGAPAGIPSPSSNIARVTGIHGHVDIAYFKGKTYYQKNTPGVRVDLSGNGLQTSTTTGINGEYFFNLAPGTYSLTYSYTGYVPQTHSVTVPGNRNVYVFQGQVTEKYVKLIQPNATQPW